MSLNEGDLVAGKFRIEEKLGEGGMGVVWAARDEALGRKVALKVLPATLATQQDMAQRFLREAMAAAQLDNDHAVRIFDQGRLPEGTPYIVMERLEGEDLDEVLAARGRLPIPVAVDYTLQACVALSAAHNKGIVHRDLKPANLFLHRTDAGRTVIKVLDFGIAKLLDAPKAGAALTRTNQQLGTPLYMSPEQHLGDTVDARTDIWSLGVILFELLSGKRPFDGETFGRVLQAVCNEDPPALEKLGDVPEGLAAVVRRCLSKDRDGRYPTVASLVLDLGVFAAPESRRLIESIHPPPSSLDDFTGPTSPATRLSEGAAGAVSGSAATGTADTKLAITKEPATAPRGRGSWLAIALLGGLAGVGAFAWSLLPAKQTPSKEAVAQDAPAPPRDAPHASEAREPETTPVVDSEAAESGAKREVAAEHDAKTPAPESDPAKPGKSRSLAKTKGNAGKVGAAPKAGADRASTQEPAGDATFNVSVRVQHPGRSCAAQPGGTQLTLVVGDFSQRQTLNGCRATFVGIPTKYKGKTASFAGSGSLCSLSGGGALGSSMVVSAKRRAAPCSADGVAACECKNPCLGHECL